MITTTIVGAVYLALQAQLYLAALLVALVAFYQVIWLIGYVEKTNKDLARLLSAIKYSDYSQSFTDGKRGRSYDELSQAFRRVMDSFRETRSEKETNSRYLETVMQHIGVGLISFTADGSVYTINTAAKRLLRVPYLKNIESLRSFNNDIVDTLYGMRYGDKKLVNIVDDDELLQLVVHATEFKIGDDLFKLVSIQDIQHELDEKEIEAWQKLTRVLTHEIMNSVAPISSLAATANSLLDETTETDLLTSDSMVDVRSAVKTIERRSRSLLHFVNDYRKLTRVPVPNFKIVSVQTVFDDVLELLIPSVTNSELTIEQDINPPQLEVAIDQELIEQVLINLVKNAIQATADTSSPTIRLEGKIDRRGRAVIRVIDNGKGIVEEAIDKIFIPFFTTKKDGSGIGLSLSREIMRQHGGSIGVSSTPNERTAFTLRF